VIVGFDLKENLRGISWNAKINQHINNDLHIITSPPTVRKNVDSLLPYLEKDRLHSEGSSPVMLL